MNQAVSVRSTGIVCPACGQEGQRITCSSGSKSEVVIYHPDKKFHTTCRVASDGNTQNEREEIERDEEQHETDTVEAR